VIGAADNLPADDRLADNLLEDHRVYHFDEGVLSVPRGFRDRSEQKLEWVIDNSSSMVLVIQRERLGWGTFEDFVRNETRDYASAFLGFKADEASLPDPFDGNLPLRRFLFRYKGDHDVLYHHQVFVFSAPLVLVFTTKSKAVHREKADVLMKQALEGLRFREEG
jgi:hypothetical protein